MEFIFTNAVRDVACPRCFAQPGEKCRQPAGRKINVPHGERVVAYKRSITDEEFQKRHSIVKE